MQRAEFWQLPAISQGRMYGRTASGSGDAGEVNPLYTVTVQVTDNTNAVTTGDGKAFIGPLPSWLNGTNLVSVSMYNDTTSSSGIPTLQLRRIRRTGTTSRATADMLSTKLTIDAGEYFSSDATPAVIDAANDDILTDDIIGFDIDAAGTGVKAIIVRLNFQFP